MDLVTFIGTEAVLTKLNDLEHWPPTIPIIGIGDDDPEGGSGILIATYGGQIEAAVRWSEHKERSERDLYARSFLATSVARTFGPVKITDSRYRNKYKMDFDYSGNQREIMRIIDKALHCPGSPKVTVNAQSSVLGRGGYSTIRHVVDHVEIDNKAILRLAEYMRDYAPIVSK